MNIKIQEEIINLFNVLEKENILIFLINKLKLN